MTGVVPLRGDMCPVYSFRGILGLPLSTSPEDTWFVLLRHKENPFILWVDAIDEVQRFKIEQIEPMPPYLLGKRSDLYYCLGKMNGMLFSIIHPDRIVKDDAALQQAISEARHGIAS